VAAGRWADSENGVLVEGQAPASWLAPDGLPARGHRVLRLPSYDDAFGHAQLIVAAGEGLAAASDPRSPTWAIAAL
jgi:gamma-glutamyltranspeptidase